MNPKNLLVDGKRVGDVIEYSAICTEEKKEATIVFTVCGKRRMLTCELEAVSFGETTA